MEESLGGSSLLDDPIASLKEEILVILQSEHIRL